jgi:hypothetical protein
LSACFKIRNSRSHQARPQAENLPESSFQKCAAAEIFAGLVGERLGFNASAYNEPVEGPMAKKKRKPDKRRKPFPDRRAMEGVSAGPLSGELEV